MQNSKFDLVNYFVRKNNRVKFTFFGQGLDCLRSGMKRKHRNEPRSVGEQRTKGKAIYPSNEKSAVFLAASPAVQK